ncbi:hypothetical protein [Cognatishimia sp. F0-27]|uniref:hypothetical protein n=1 Tax=Cognatishimia sp. F0-27 TaxID=2816855 RepID=UPI001D0C6E13|nr:hypothetical protein [Cognatishimia sp. F0-27]MCC1493316.1 hypothetical protein [Cognatishimia sp. F0-27]
MNANRLMTMVARRIVNRLVAKSRDQGVERRLPQDDPPMPLDRNSKAERHAARDARKRTRRALQAMKIARRAGRL